jgi:hypothetical protein
MLYQLSYTHNNRLSTLFLGKIDPKFNCNPPLATNRLRNRSQIVHKIGRVDGPLGREFKGNILRPGNFKSTVTFKEKKRGPLTMRR